MVLRQRLLDRGEGTVPGRGSAKCVFGHGRMVARRRSTARDAHHHPVVLDGSGPPTPVPDSIGPASRSSSVRISSPSSRAVDDRPLRAMAVPTPGSSIEPVLGGRSKLHLRRPVHAGRPVGGARRAAEVGARTRHELQREGRRVPSGASSVDRPALRAAGAAPVARRRVRHARSFLARGGSVRSRRARRIRRDARHDRTRHPPTSSIDAEGPRQDVRPAARSAVEHAVRRRRISRCAPGECRRVCSAPMAAARARRCASSSGSSSTSSAGRLRRLRRRGGPTRAARERTGFVPEEARRFGRLSGRETVDLFARLQNVGGRAQRAPGPCRGSADARGTARRRPGTQPRQRRTRAE